MALVTCPDCKAEVSDAAAACLRCGRPVDRAAADPLGVRLSWKEAVTYGLIAAILGGVWIYANEFSHWGCVEPCVKAHDRAGQGGAFARAECDLQCTRIGR